MRPSGRSNDQIREVTIEINVSKHAEGSCLISFGDTKVLCTASLEENVPPFLKGRGKGWVTAEYNMLPRATGRRMKRESSLGKQSGRTHEIQRLIARSLRAVTDLDALGERQVIVDCDVLQADGGTRTASITGAYVALYLACKVLVNRRLIHKIPLEGEVAAISCGIVDGEAVADLDYIEDSSAEVDANFVMTGNGSIVEIQGTAEQSPFSEDQLNEMLSLAKSAIKDLVKMQKKAINQ